MSIHDIHNLPRSPLFKWQQVICLSFVNILGLFWAISSSLAHHGAVVSRPNTPRPMANQLNSVRSQSLLIQSYLEFSQWQSQSPQQSIYNQLDLGELQMYLVDLRLNYSIHKNLNTTLSLPFNYFIQANQEQKEQTWGLGDINLNLQYLLSGSSQLKDSSISKATEQTYNWNLSFGTIIPSGHYQREAILSDSQLIADTNGSLELSSFSAQTSLGADSWQIVLGTSLNWVVSKRWISYLNLNTNIPLSKTRDGIHWGTDINLSNLHSHELSPRFALFWGGQFAVHLPDQINQSTQSGQSEVTVGGHKQLFLPLGLEITVKQKVRCRLQAEIPLWQQIKVPQLLKTYAISVSC